MVENRCYGPFNTWAYGDAHPRVVARSWLGWWKGRVSYVPWSKHGIWVMVIHPRPRILRMGAKTPVKGLMGKQSGRIHVQSQSSCILALEERRDLVESCLHMAVLLEQRQNVTMWQILKLASNWPQIGHIPGFWSFTGSWFRPKLIQFQITRYMYIYLDPVQVGLERSEVLS
jgi:hypothetical protein